MYSQNNETPTAPRHATIVRILRRLAPTAAGLLNELAYLTAIRAQRHPNAPAYLQPSRAYLARASGASIRSMTRAADRLVSLGLLWRIRRRRARGRWSTNLYMLTSFAHRVLGSLRSPAKPPTPRATSGPHSHTAIGIRQFRDASASLLHALKARASPASP